MRTYCLIAITVALSGCAPTEFVGEAHFGTVDECKSQCASLGEELGAFSYLGEYSTLCTCRFSNADYVEHVGAVQLAVTGVVMEMRARSQAAANNAAIHAAHHAVTP